MVKTNLKSNKDDFYDIISQFTSPLELYFLKKFYSLFTF